MNVGIYCRISVDKGGRDKSIEDQSKLGIEFAKSNKYKYDLFIDEGLSGTIDERPQFKRLLTEVVDGKIQIIWVFDDSRIQRSPEIRYLLNNTLKQYKVQYYTHINGLVDLFNPESDLMGGIMAEFNKYFVTISKLKVKSVLRRRVLGGRGWGGLPYGYSYDTNGYYVINKSEAKVVKTIFKLSLLGTGTDAIARYLNEKEIPTRYNDYKGDIKLHKKKGGENLKIIPKKNLRWAGNTVRGILNNTMFYGIKKINDLTLEVPAIFSIKYWEEVNFNLKNKNRNTLGKGGTKKHQYLLNGIIKCSWCGRNYNGKTRISRKDHFYYCMGKRSLEGACKNRSINIDKIENFVWSVLFVDQRLFEAIKSSYSNTNDSNLVNNLLKKENQSLTNALKGKDNILEMVKRGTLTPEDVADKMSEIRLEIELHRQKITELSSQVRNIERHNFADLANDSSFFLKMKFEDKHRLVRKYIKSIYIDWIDCEYNGQKVKYYKVSINYNVNDIQELYTNSWSLNMDEWFKVAYDKNKRRAYFDYCFKPNSLDKNKEMAFFINQGTSYPDYTTLAPNGNSGLWDYNDYCSYYGENKYLKLKAELDHKIKSETFRPIPQHK
jgi:site-specific DNA recombinase